MPKSPRVLLGACILMSNCYGSFARAAEPYAGIAARYSACLSKGRAEKVNAIKSSCATSQSDAAMAACNAQADQADSNVIQLCKITTGMVKVVRDPEESQDGVQTVSPPPTDAFNGLPINHVSELGANDPLASDGVSHPPIPTPRPNLTNPAKANGAKTNTTNNQTTGTANRASTATTSPKTTNSAPTPTNDSYAAQAEAQGDLASCSAVQSRAMTCCNNPMACASGGDRQTVQRLRDLAQSGDSAGLQSACRQMQATGDGSSALNSNLGAACTSSQYSCSNTCSSLEQKYLSLMNSCPDCDSASIYSSTYQTLMARRQSCDGLSARADALSRQGLQASSSAYGEYCSQASATSAQSAPGSFASLGGSGASLNSPTSSDCASNPGRADCVAKAQAQLPAAARGESGFQNGDSSARKFALPMVDTSPMDGPVATGKASEAPQVATVPNGGAGSVPGANGQGASAQAQVAAGANRASAGAPGFSTDVDQGLRSGGYSPPVDPQTGQPWASAGLGRRAGGLKEDDGGYKGMDLKQFLPGGSRDPSRRLAGAAFRSEINAKEEDIWLRISNKIVEKCRLGVLWQCR